MGALRQAALSLRDGSAPRSISLSPLARGRAPAAGIRQHVRGRARSCCCGALAATPPADLSLTPGAGRSSPPDHGHGGLIMPIAEQEAWEIATTAATSE